MGAKSTDIPMVLNANVGPRERAIDRRGAIMGPPMSWEMEQYLSNSEHATRNGEDAVTLAETDPRAFRAFAYHEMGRSTEEIAKAMGCSVRTVYRLLERGRAGMGELVVSPRAATVFSLTCHGWRQKGIAEVLSISTRTVRRLLREAEAGYGETARVTQSVRRSR